MKVLSSAVILTVAPLLATAGTVRDGMEFYLGTAVRAKLMGPPLVETMTSASTGNAALLPNSILVLNGPWRAEVASDSALLKCRMESPTPVMRRDPVATVGDKVTEFVLMDLQGQKLSVSDVTTTCWQGNQDKLAQTRELCPMALHVFEIETDESRWVHQAQVSVAITDPTTGHPKVAVPIGPNARAL